MAAVRKHWEWGRKHKNIDKLTVASFSTGFASGGPWRRAVIPLME
jgi:hypothetical protein